MGEPDREGRVAELLLPSRMLAYSAVAGTLLFVLAYVLPWVVGREDEGLSGVLLSLLVYFVPASLLFLPPFLFVGWFVARSGLRMDRTLDRRTCVLAATVASIPVVSPGLVIGMPFGLWTLAVLLRPGVRSALARRPSNDRFLDGLVSVSLSGALILLYAALITAMLVYA